MMRCVLDLEYTDRSACLILSFFNCHLSTYTVHILSVTGTRTTFSGLQHYHCEWKPSIVQGDIEGEKIVQISSKGDCVLAVSERGDLFGWGNSEYGQLSAITDQTQVSVPRNLPLPHSVTKAAAAGSKCAILTGIHTISPPLLSLPEVKAVQSSLLFPFPSLFFF